MRIDAKMDKYFECSMALDAMNCNRVLSYTLRLLQVPPLKNVLPPISLDCSDHRDRAV